MDYLRQEEHLFPNNFQAFSFFISTEMCQHKINYLIFIILDIAYKN